ncbi:pentatricopeptide repeat-containing protein At1g10910, chloroplastic-like [Humulus lupulus]|uniref:pentatricopeptide repeat-containing protein At1g10910, chloroplastic-like n=1 Tax=Humulus lupulus TaxID=3486 RepID=UPI002B418311|nr:pentatricopeptide repeat-containing protein At1g10910, chloroplastic-like [Humulus lupulus]
MEVSILGARMQHIMPCSFPLPYSFSPSISTTPNNSYLIYAKASPTTTTTFVKGENIEQPNNGEVKRNRTPSKSYSARKFAILEIQLSPDLDSALTSYGDILKVQDLNVILRHFGMRKRWHKLSQLLSGCIKAKQGYPIAMELVQKLQQNDVQMDNEIYGTLHLSLFTSGRP